MTLRLSATPLTAALAGHGEGPVTVGDALVWLDMLRGDVLVTDSASGATRRVALGADIVSLVRPCVDGDVLVATDRELWRYRDGLTGSPALVATLPVPPTTRLNEGGCDAHGRLWIGSMAADSTVGAGQLFRVDTSGAVQSILDGLTISNGIAFAPDGTTGYFVDSSTRRIDRLLLDGNGDLVERQPWVATDRYAGVPDGLTLDAVGGVWVAVYGGGVVVRFGPDGDPDIEVHVPVSNVTACAFVGTSPQLAITTSRGDAAEVSEPGAGALYVATTPVVGVPVVPFGARRSIRLRGGGWT